MTRRPGAIAALGLAACLLSLATACGGKLPPPAAAAPRYTDFMFPALSPPDPRQAALATALQGGWQFLQAGDLNRAEKEFQAVLKKSPAFYPGDVALGYVDLARKNYPPALEHFDRVVAARATYVPALVGRGETLLALSRDADALAAFEAALRLDSTLSDIGRRVEVLRARAAQENVAAARGAAQAGRLDDAARAYEQAITASPDSAFLFRDLADIEAKLGKTDDALPHYRKAIQLDPTDVASRIRVAEMLEARGDVEGAMALYAEADGLEPSADLKRRLTALEARAAYLRLPEEYRALGDQPAISRGDLAALIGIRLESLVAGAPAQAVLVTDTRNHWAARWIMTVSGAGVMDPYDNHTFQPRTVIRRGDLAHAVSRMLKIIAARQPALLKDWQSRQARMSDVGVSNLNYADASLAVSAGILPLVDGGAFQLTRAVSGAEAIDAVTKLERLYNASK
jgi:tetratricopeptide (TPR) repeat protein